MENRYEGKIVQQKRFSSAEQLPFYSKNTFLSNDKKISSAFFK